MASENDLRISLEICYYFKRLLYFNPLPRTEKKHILEDHFSSVLSQFKKYQTPGYPKFNYSRIFQSLNLRISLGKTLSISLELNFTPNTFKYC